MMIFLIQISILVTAIAYIVWVIRSLLLKKYRTATILVLIGVVFVGGAAYVIHWAIEKAASTTDPYLIEPMSVSPAPIGTTIGHTINGSILSVISDSNVVCVADPGVSFQYEVIWLVPMPKATREIELIEYRFQLPPYADTQHVNGLNAEVPAKIKTAEARRNRWI